MKVGIDVPDYSAEHGLRMVWEAGSIITVKLDGEVIHVTANQDGLVSLARLLLTLADPLVPLGSHWHLDASNALEDGSNEIIVEKL